MFGNNKVSCSVILGAPWSAAWYNLVQKCFTCFTSPLVFSNTPFILTAFASPMLGCLLYRWLSVEWYLVDVGWQGWVYRASSFWIFVCYDFELVRVSFSGFPVWADSRASYAFREIKTRSNLIRFSRAVCSLNMCASRSIIKRSKTIRILYALKLSRLQTPARSNFLSLLRKWSRTALRRISSGPGFQCRLRCC